MLPTVAQQEAQIRAYAASIGIDPDIAVTVARSEGLSPGTWQSNVQQPYGREASYGAFQLHVDPTGKRPGLGNEFVAKTGLDPRDMANWEEMNRFALDQVRKQGWGPWMGAKAAGITGMMGVGAPPREDRGMPYNSGYGRATTGGLLDAPAPAGSDVREDRGGPYNSGYGAAAPDAAKAPGEFDWEELKKLGNAVSQASAPDQEKFEWLKPQVLQPLRRFQLGEGIL